MISTALKQLIDDIYRQLDIAIDTLYRFDIYKDRIERRMTHGELAINALNLNRRGDYKDFIVNLYIDRDYFFREVMQGSYGPVDPLSHEILEKNNVMGEPIVLTFNRCGENDQPPYKIFITMKGEE